MTSPLATLPSTAKEKPEGIAVTAANSRDWDVKVVHDGKPEATIFRACQSPKRHKGAEQGLCMRSRSRSFAGDTRVATVASL